jgi:TolB protein
MTPLPKSIVGMEDLTSSYVTSPDGSKLAYAGPGDNGSSQIFVANLDGTGVEQVTTGDKATAPDWSPDGSRIAYIGPGADTNNVFVLDLATGSSTQLTYHTWPKGANGPYFSPNGSSILYGVYDEDGHGSHARMVPTSGGESVLGGVYGAQLSPDGSLMSYRCDPIPFTLCLANADGSDARVLLEASDAIGSGRWSPDGTRIAYGTWHSFQAYVVDVATGEQTNVADGVGPVWLDDHTLIVEQDRCPGPGGSDSCGG